MITLPPSLRLYASPIANLTAQSLSRQLDEFHAGHFANVARTFEAIEQRDDILKGVSAKRKKAPARLPWHIETSDETPAAIEQRSAVEKMLASLTVRSAEDKNLRGGLPMLIELVMDAVGKKYACCELRFLRLGDGTPSAALQFVPLWHFENQNGTLHLVGEGGALTPLDEREWIVAVGDGLMEASSIGYLYKHLPMRDWLVYCERNGMPGVKGTTDAQPGSPEWENAKSAVESFGAEFTALLSKGADIEAIDLSTRGELPYPKLVERMDKALTALWRGSDLSTLSRTGVGASLQKDETALVEENDAQWVADTLNTQLVAPFVRAFFGPAEPIRVEFALRPLAQLDREIATFTLLKNLGLPIPAQVLYERLGLPLPTEKQAAQIGSLVDASTPNNQAGN